MSGANLTTVKTADGWLPSIFTLVAVAVLVGSTAYAGIMLTREFERIASIWLANGVLLSFLLCSEKQKWPALLITGFTANALANAAAGDSPGILLSLSLLNSFEVSLAALLLVPRLGQNPDLGKLPEFFRFSLFAVIIAPLFSALPAGLFMKWLANADYAQTFMRWYLSDALGMAIVTPIGLSILRGDLAALLKDKSILHVISGLLLIQAVAGAVFYQTTHPYLFFVPPALMATAAVLGFKVIPLAMITLTINALAFTLYGHGPFNLIDTEDLGHKVINAQMFILLNFLLSVYIADASDQLRTADKEIKERNFKLTQSERLLAASENRFRMLSENSADMIFRLTEDGTINYASPAVTENLGWPIEELIGQRSVAFIHPDDRFINAVHAKNLAEQDGTITDHLRILSKDARIVWVERKTRRVQWEGKTAFVSNLRDITRKKEALAALAEANQKLENLANTDGLTGLKNRRFLNSTMSAEWNRARRADKPVTLLLIDVDRFKLYNDTYGHQGGDNCLQSLASCLQNFARRPGDCAGRYGGEELALLLSECDAENGRAIAEKVRAAIEHLAIPHTGNTDCGGIVTVSIGVSTLSPAQLDSNSNETLLISQADEHLYQAKKTGRNKVISAVQAATL